MCILFIKLLTSAKFGEFKLILGANRDEFFKRPGKIAHFWEEDMNIFGGRDMTENKQGGTWLAISKKGKIGVLLNVTGEETNPQKLGRGFLVVDYLKSPLNAKEYLKKVQENSHLYNKFHLVTAALGSKPSLLHYSNGVDATQITEVEGEIFAISNSPLKTPFQKVTAGKQRFEEICNKYGKVEQKATLIKEILNFLKWEKKHYPDEIIDSLPHLPIQFKSRYSSVFVKAPELHYGTRTHTIILVDWKNEVDFHEWTLKEPIDPEHLEWNETHQQFQIFSNSPEFTI